MSGHSATTAASGKFWTDATGTRHTAAGPDARIVSLVPSQTELLIGLGLGPQIVGRTRFCIHPADVVAGIPAIGGTKKAHLGRLRDLAPSHVVLNIDENTREMAAAIGEFVPNLVVTHPLVPDDNLTLFELLGGIFGRETEAARLTDDYAAARARLESATRDLPAKKVVYLIWKDPWMTVSQDTYISALLRLANWHTLCHDPDVRYPKIELDKTLLAEADLVLFSSEPFSFTQEHLDELREAHPDTRARFELVDGEYLSWFGTRAIAGLDYLAELAVKIA